mmetsp:Transcript_33164/g.80216  ORF Transcript_33164/g.80216 Transcript_33164/m.80216 type:complete len:308 (+) Transcript_33164:150-1073(+)
MSRSFRLLFLLSVSVGAVLAFQPRGMLGPSLTTTTQSPSSTSTCIEPLSKELPRNHERIVTFDTKEFPLCELVADALECHQNELDELHTREPEDYCTQGQIRGSLASTRTPLRRIELLRRALTTKWKMSSQKRIWENDYLPGIVRDVVGSDIMPNEQHLIYQRSPMLRFHVAWPLQPEEVAAYDNTIPPLGGRNPGTLAGLHTDKEYGHPHGEVNFFLPVTHHTHDTNSLHVEGDAMRGDFKPFELRYGEIMMWNGNTCRHCSPRNISNQTRISFDFRVIAGSDWIDPPKKEGYFQLGGYYVDANSV